MLVERCYKKGRGRIELTHGVGTLRYEDNAWLSLCKYSSRWIPTDTDACTHTPNSPTSSTGGSRSNNNKLAINTPGTVSWLLNTILQ